MNVTNVGVGSQEIRAFLLQAIADGSPELIRDASTRFSISRQSVHRQVRALITDGLVAGTGRTRGRTYRLVPLVEQTVSVPLAGLAEDVLWRREVQPHLALLPQNVLDIWQYGVTEMVNNAIDHSGGTTLHIALTRTAVTTQVRIADDGVGIFRKLREACHLEDERHAVLELAKGKLTTDPQRHTGEGIFFASRMFDRYAILSGGVFFSHTLAEAEDWILETEQPRTGTLVTMELQNASPRRAQKVFDAYTAAPEDYGFTKTVVPVRLARHGEENLVSRSQAKRLLARVERFRVVVLDFAGVDAIGQAFADEVFRVFPAAHPGVTVVPVHTGPAVDRMIARARASEPGSGSVDPRSGTPGTL